MTEDVDPENPQPVGHPEKFRSNLWHYIPDELANTIMLGRPSADSEPGDDWLLTYTPERQNPEDREQVFVRLTPQALDRLYNEAKFYSPEARQARDTAECDECGEPVPLKKAVPNKRYEPVHRRCYVYAYGGPKWLADH